MEGSTITCATTYRGRLRGKVGLLSTTGPVDKKPAEAYAVMFDGRNCNLRHPLLMQEALATTRL